MTLLDGPAKGSYLVKRAPLFLRAVVNSAGKGDVLDQIDDTPAADETISVYRRVGEAGHVHLNMRDRRRTGFYALASYEWLADVDGETVRETREWHAWCSLEPKPEVRP